MFDKAMKWALHDPEHTKKMATRAAIGGAATIAVFTAGMAVGDGGATRAPERPPTVAATPAPSAPSVAGTTLPVGASAETVTTAYLNAWLKRATYPTDDAGNRAWLDTVKPHATVSLGQALEADPTQAGKDGSTVPVGKGGAPLAVTRVDNVFEIGDRLLVRATLSNRATIDVGVAGAGNDEWRVAQQLPVGKTAKPPR